MKYIIIIAAFLSMAAQAQTTTHCWKNADGSITCVRSQGGSGF
jgi:hypothetical protein